MVVRNPMTNATAEGRLYNRSPRLACLPTWGRYLDEESTAEGRLYELFAFVLLDLQTDMS